MTDIVESMKPTLSWLTKRMVRNHINKLNKKVKMRGDAARPDEDAIAGRHCQQRRRGIHLNTFSFDAQHQWQQAATRWLVPLLCGQLLARIMLADILKVALH